MKNGFDVLVVGAGIFGITAVSELNARGYKTAVIDPGPLPHPLAASTDISKVIRMEYGPDEQYMEMVEVALPMWRQWNEILGEPLFHEVGVSMLAKHEMQPGEFEYESYQMLHKRGHQPDRLSPEIIREHFPAWNATEYVDGYFHKLGGFAESGRVVATLAEQAKRDGVTLIGGESVVELLLENGRVRGVKTDQGNRYEADHVVIAAGAWTHVLLPELAPVMKASGHPVFHLRPSNPELFTPPNFVVFTADISHSGWYGFPYHPHEKVVKIANHGVGLQLHPTDDERVVTDADEQHLRHFLADTFPALVDAPIVYTRRCLYCDTLDEHFWIDQHPQIKGLSVAAGGSGHGYKFAPILGPLIADAVEEKPNKWLPKFRWRHLDSSKQGEEAARYHGDEG